MYLSLYCKGSKRVTQGLRVRGSWRPNRNWNILTPTVSVVSFLFSRAAQPDAKRPTLLGDGFLYCILSATSLDPNSSGAPRAPLAWPGFPYHILSATYLQLQLIRGPKGPFSLMWLSLPHLVYNSASNRLTSVLTELYNSSTPTQSPTQSLEWHV